MKSIITTRVKDGIEYVLWRDDEKPWITYLGVGDELTLISIKEFMEKYS